jgi:hypothetical protein
MSNDLHIFGLLKKYLPGKRGATDSEMKQIVISWLQTLNTDFFCAKIQALVPWWVKGKAIPLWAWTGPEGSKRLRLPDFKTGGKVVSPTHWLPLPPGNIPGTRG